MRIKTNLGYQVAGVPGISFLAVLSFGVPSSQTCITQVPRSLGENMDLALDMTGWGDV